MIVSGEVKMGQTESRARNRRRVGELDARHREVAVASNSVSSNATIRGVVTSFAPIVVDVDDDDDVVLSSRRSFAHVSPIVSSNATVRGAVTSAAPIAVDDDDDEDDDVVLSSPRSYAYALFKASVEHHRSTRHARVPVPSELRLGPGHGTPEYSSRTNCTQQPRQGHRRRPARPTIDLTTPSIQAPVNDDCAVLHECTKSKKRKNPVALEPSFITEIPPITPVHEAEEYKLKCAICMETMKDETSTICGHIFCQNCIHGAVRTQKKCPTCRKKLTLKNVHRIYL